MCELSECGRYCVSTATSKIPEFTQLESGKSIIRNLPAKGTDGLARFSERTLRRVPSPPAMIMATIRTKTSNIDSRTVIQVGVVRMSAILYHRSLRLSCDGAQLIRVACSHCSSAGPD